MGRNPFNDKSMTWDEWREIPTVGKGSVNGFITPMIILLGVVILVYGVVMFYAGLHNVDLMFNRCLISLDSGDTSIWEANEHWVDGTVSTTTEAYNVGLSQIMDSLRFIIGGAILFGIGLGSICDVHDTKSVSKR